MSQDERGSTTGVRTVFIRALIVAVTLALMVASAAGGYEAAKRFDFLPSGGAPRASSVYVLETPVFSTPVPLAPTMDVEIVVDVGLEIALTTWSVESPDADMEVRSADYTALIAQEGLTAQVLFDRTIAATLTELPGTLSLSKDEALGDDPARRAAIELPDETVYIYLVVHNGNLVTITAVAPTGEPPPAFERAIAGLTWKA